MHKNLFLFCLLLQLVQAYFRPFDVEINDLKVNISTYVQHKYNGGNNVIKFKHCIAETVPFN